MKLDAHHHLWNLDAVHYPWLMARGEPRFFGDPSSIQRDYLIEEFRSNAAAHGFTGSVHIQVGAADGFEEAKWVDKVAETNPDWPMVQVAFCDLTDPDREIQLDRLMQLPSVRGVRQIVGRAPGEDAANGTNDLLRDEAFLEGLRSVAQRGLSFDLQLLPELMEQTADLLADVPDLCVALCHGGSPHDRSTKGIDFWAKQLETLSGLPNLHCKLSGFGMFDHQWQVPDFAPLVDVCLSQFGASRCMFGSNFPVDSLSSSYSRLVGAYETLIPSSDHDAVFGSVAQSFYDLSAVK